MTKAIRNFIWSGSILQKKLVQVSWKKCCRPKEEGGLGLRDLSLLNKALLKKFAWRVMTVDSDLFSYLRARFFRSNGDLDTKLNPPFGLGFDLCVKIFVKNPVGWLEDILKSNFRLIIG